VAGKALEGRRDDVLAPRSAARSGRANQRGSRRWIVIDVVNSLRRLRTAGLSDDVLDRNDVVDHRDLRK
jgi:hypothetical protein